LDELVCIAGTLQHQALFCNNGVKITILNRSLREKPYPQEIWINQMRKVNYTFIDVSMDLLPTIHACFPHLLMPTEHWNTYLQKNNIDFNKDNYPTVEKFVSEYIKLWAERAINEFTMPLLSRFTMADVIISLQKYLLGIEIDENISDTIQVN